MPSPETTNPCLTPEREFAVPGRVVFRSRDRVPDLGPAGAPQAQTRAWGRGLARARAVACPLSVQCASVMPVHKTRRGRSSRSSDASSLLTSVLFDRAELKESERAGL